MSIISQQLATCIRVASSSNLSDCKPWGFSLADCATIVGFLGGAVAAGFFAVRWVLSKIPFRRPGEFRTFWGMKKALRPLADENARIFSEFGPNSGANAKGPVRFDLSVWARAKPKIAENNAQIAKIIRENGRQIPKHHAAIFRAWLSHIDAFAAHVEDSAVDYRDHTFPKEVTKIIGSA